MSLPSSRARAFFRPPSSCCFLPPGLQWGAVRIEELRFARPDAWQPATKRSVRPRGPHWPVLECKSPGRLPRERFILVES